MSNSSTPREITSVILIVEGTIASGKTTLVDNIKSSFPTEQCESFNEEFLKNCPHLVKYYSCKDREQARLLVMAVQSWIIAYSYGVMVWLKERIGKTKLLIIDRCPIGSLPFIQDALNNNVITLADYNHLLALYTACINEFKEVIKDSICLMTILSCDYRISYSRVLDRDGTVSAGGGEDTLDNNNNNDDPLFIKLSTKRLMALEHLSTATLLRTWIDMFPKAKPFRKYLILNTSATKPADIATDVSYVLKDFVVFKFFLSETPNPRYPPSNEIPQWYWE